MVTEVNYYCLLGYRNNVGHLEACGDRRLGQGEIECVRKHTSQLVRTRSEDVPSGHYELVGHSHAFFPVKGLYFRVPNMTATCDMILS